MRIVSSSGMIIPLQNTAEELYINLNLEMPVAAWAAGRGILLPAQSGKLEKGWVSVMLATLLKNGRSARLKNEHLIEGVRQKKYPSAVSRLTGLFYFGDRESALRAVNEWGCSFKESNLTSVKTVGDEAVSRYDSNWYTDAPRNDDQVFDSNYLEWIDKYLSGEPMPGKEPLWEYVTDRRLNITDKSFQDRAVDMVQKTFPESVILFEIACAGARAGFDVGNISAFLLLEDKECTLTWRLDFRDAENPAFLNRLKEPGIIGDINEFLKKQFASGSFGRAPDLRPYGWAGDLPGPGNNWQF